VEATGVPIGPAAWITVCTVVQNCCKGNEPCQWNTPIFRPSGIDNPWNDRPQIWQGWLCRGYHPTYKLWYFYLKGGGCTYAWNQCKKTYQFI